MNKEMERNIELMGKLIMKMNRFSEDELVTRLRKRRALLLPLSWTVARYLDYFHQLGALHLHSDGQFEVVKG